MDSYWDDYFTSHYQPIGRAWSRNDVEKYKQWYFSWINYIEKRCPALQSQADIFEIGSAVGAVAESLLERGHRITGSDISGNMVNIAARLCGPVKFIYCDIQKQVPVHKKFDIVLGFEVLEHVPDLAKALANIRSALKANGFFVGTSPYPYPKNYLDRTHVNVKYPREWKTLFTKTGFSKVDILPMSFLPYLWRINKYLNIVLPFYTGLPYIVSTALIIAKR